MAEPEKAVTVSHADKGKDSVLSGAGHYTVPSSPPICQSEI